MTQNAVSIPGKIVELKVVEKQPEQAVVTAQLDESMKRPKVLAGSTYQLKTPLASSSVYITINNIVLNEGTEHQSVQPFEIFINCLAGDTPVLTRNGLVPIKELAGRTIEVLNGKGKWVSVLFKSYGKRKVYPLRFKYSGTHTERNSFIVKATEGHRWVLEDGSVITTEFWLNNRLNKSNKYVPNIRAPKQEMNKADYENGLIHGLVYGDGTINQYWEYEFDLDLVGEKIELSQLVEMILGAKPKPTDYGNGCEGLRFHRIAASGTDLKSIPDTYDPSYLSGFFSGLLATDGRVSDKGEVMLYGGRALMEFLWGALPTIGIVPTRYRLMGAKGAKTNFGKRNVEVWVMNIQPATVDHTLLLRSKHRDNHRVSDKVARNASRWEFLGCEGPPQLEEVFCCTEPETNSFVIHRGMLTGNCKEMESYQWIVALTLLISAIFRKGGDVTFIIDQLKSVFDPRGGYLGRGGHVPSLVAEIGSVIEEHFKIIGLLEHDDSLKQAIEQKKQQHVSQGGSLNGSECPKCHSMTLVPLDGCPTCLTCAYSKCG